MSSKNEKANELRYFDALKRITCYQSPERLRKESEHDWGLPYEEALEYAYENVLNEARVAIKGKRMPKAAPQVSAPATTTAGGGGQ